MERLKRELFAVLRARGAALCGRCFAVCPYTQRWLRAHKKGAS